MDELKCFDTEQLEAELKRHKEEEKGRNKPQPVANPDWSTVQRYCQEQVDTIFQGKYVDSDSDHYIYEAAMEAVFGRNVWSWINARMR